MYNYLKEMTRDIVDYVKDNYTLKDLEDPDFRDTLYDELWIEDDITGNGVRGSYWTINGKSKSRAIVLAELMLICLLKHWKNSEMKSRIINAHLKTQILPTLQSVAIFSEKQLIKRCKYSPKFSKKKNWKHKASFSFFLAIKRGRPRLGHIL